MRVIAVANQKGGSAKTTTTINLGAALALQGKRTLLIDLDPQGHVAEGLGIPAESIDLEISAVLENRAKLRDIVQPVRPNLDLAPANILLSQTEAQLFAKTRREDRLKNALKHLDPDAYDFILIDSPPSLGLLTVNVLSAAREVLVTMAAEFYALLGVGLLLNTIEDIRTEVNPDLQILGIVATRVTRTVHSREVIEHVGRELQDRARLLKTTIKEQVCLRSAAAEGKTIFEFDPSSDAAAAYADLAREVIRLKPRRPV